LAYHVQIRRSIRRASAFNLSRETLQRTVVGPWLEGRTFELGGREWDPGECDLRVLEGPALSPQELAYGQGWANAERAGRDVAAELLRQRAAADAVLAVLAESTDGREAVGEALRSFGIQLRDFAQLRDRLVRGAPAGERRRGGAVVIVVESAEPAPRWLFDAGLALGAFAARAFVVALGATEVPAELGRGADVRLDPGEPATVCALAELLVGA
jgi:hypothetical protein